MRTFISFFVALMMFQLPSMTFAANASTYQDTEKMSTEEKLASATQLMIKMQASLTIVLNMLQEAHESKDIIKINAINDKLSTIKGLVRIAEEASISLKEAAITAQSDLINHEYTKIVMASEKINILVKQVEATVNQTSTDSSNNQTTANVEVSDSSISAYQPLTSDQDLALLPVISSERPEAISTNQ